MKISYNWLKDYLNLPLSLEQVSEGLTSTGLEVDGIETYESLKGGLEGLVIGQVIFKAKHPDADKLSVTKVDIGNGTVLDIVCGAPNVAEGQKVVVATPGTKLYPTEGEPFVIKKGKIRGEVSDGMICAEDEIGLGHSHDGIMVLPADTAVGTPAAEYFKIERDTIIEIGLTPNRADATNHLGVAFDLAAWYNTQFSPEIPLQKPDVSAFKVDNQNAVVQVIVEDEARCPRYAGLTISGIQVQDSPEWLKQRLKAIGARSINNVVDVTNYVLHELGQPLHAFDLKAIQGNTVRVKTLASGTEFVTLDEAQRKLDAEDLMICDGNSTPMCMAGVFGGAQSGVTESTTAIFLESAHFAPVTIRRSSTRHGLRTDAATRFEKGTDPNVVLYALKRAALMIQSLAGGEISSDIVDIYPNPLERKQVNISYQYINDMIGNDLPKATVQGILHRLDMEFIEAGETLQVLIPTNKPDVHRPADVVEEILRIYGLNKVETSTAVRSAMVFSPKPDPQRMQNRAADLLAANGFLEMMSLSLTQSKYAKEVIPFEESQLVYINNTSNQHLDLMRPSMLFGALEAVALNHNRQQADLRLYEFGRTYLKGEGDSFVEEKHLTITMSGQREAESWHNKDKRELSFYSLKAQVESLLARFNLTAYQEEVIENNDTYAYGLRLYRGNQHIAFLGAVKPSVLKGMDVKKPVFYADINWDVLLKMLSNNKVEYSELSKFPAVRRDLAFVIAQKVSFADIRKIANKAGKDILQETNLFDVYENEQQLGADKKSYAVSFLFQDKTKTLQDAEVDAVINTIIAEAEKQLGALIRR